MGISVRVALVLAVGLAVFVPQLAGADGGLSLATKRLFDAVWSDDIDGVKASVVGGADLDAVNEFGIRPVDLAVDKGHYGVAHYLLSVKQMQNQSPSGLQSPSLSDLKVSVPPVQSVPVTIVKASKVGTSQKPLLSQSSPAVSAETKRAPIAETMWQPSVIAPKNVTPKIQIIGTVRPQPSIQAQIKDIMSANSQVSEKVRDRAKQQTDPINQGFEFPDIIDKSENRVERSKSLGPPRSARPSQQLDEDRVLSNIGDGQVPDNMKSDLAPNDQNPSIKVTQKPVGVFESVTGLDQRKILEKFKGFLKFKEVPTTKEGDITKARQPSVAAIKLAERIPGQEDLKPLAEGLWKPSGKAVNATAPKLKIIGTAQPQPSIPSVYSPVTPVNQETNVKSTNQVSNSNPFMGKIASFLNIIKTSEKKPEPGPSPVKSTETDASKENQTADKVQDFEATKELVNIKIASTTATEGLASADTQVPDGQEKVREVLDKRSLFQGLSTFFQSVDPPLENVKSVPKSIEPFTTELEARYEEPASLAEVISIVESPNLRKDQTENLDGAEEPTARSMPSLVSRMTGMQVPSSEQRAPNGVHGTALPVPYAASDTYVGQVSRDNPILQVGPQLSGKKVLQPSIASEPLSVEAVTSSVEYSGLVSVSKPEAADNEKNARTFRDEERSKPSMVERIVKIFTPSSDELVETERAGSLGAEPKALAKRTRKASVTAETSLQVGIEPINSTKVISSFLATPPPSQILSPSFKRENILNYSKSDERVSEIVEEKIETQEHVRSLPADRAVTEFKSIKTQAVNQELDGGYHSVPHDSARRASLIIAEVKPVLQDSWEVPDIRESEANEIARQSKSKDRDSHSNPVLSNFLDLPKTEVSENNILPVVGAALPTSASTPPPFQRLNYSKSSTTSIEPPEPKMPDQRSDDRGTEYTPRSIPTLAERALETFSPASREPEISDVDTSLDVVRLKLIQASPESPSNPESQTFSEGISLGRTGSQPVANRSQQSHKGKSPLKTAAFSTQSRENPVIVAVPVAPQVRELVVELAPSHIKLSQVKNIWKTSGNGIQAIMPDVNTIVAAEISSRGPSVSSIMNPAADNKKSLGFIDWVTGIVDTKKTSKNTAEQAILNSVSPADKPNAQIATNAIDPIANKVKASTAATLGEGSFDKKSMNLPIPPAKRASGVPDSSSQEISKNKLKSFGLGRLGPEVQPEPFWQPTGDPTQMETPNIKIVGTAQPQPTISSLDLDMKSANKKIKVRPSAASDTARKLEIIANAKLTSVSEDKTPVADIISKVEAANHDFKSKSADMMPNIIRTDDLATLPPVNRRVKAPALGITIKNPAEIKTSLNASVALRNVSFNFGLDHKLGKNVSVRPKSDTVCIEKKRWQTQFCIETISWPKDIATAFDVKSSIYRGTRGIVQYVEGNAVQIHALFPSGEVWAISEHFKNLYGPPTEMPETWTALIGAPKRPNRVMRWHSQDEKSGKETLLEIREIDDLRWSAPPDTKNGVVRILNKGTGSVFQLLSKTDLLLVTLRNKN
ncbi:MAG: hypothetical protein CBB68_12465 [Rhodospirillaceae bacterium TMED8]|nr:hypothetical protein [Magnetovibrio sp.]OUT48924.1 MAG: hypothetical protein CBB68_12465 [Rhodospirillaceae bacterium TMED8]